MTGWDQIEKSIRDRRGAFTVSEMFAHPDCLECRRRGEAFLREGKLLDGPRHTASDRCESGKHPHCTCDTCF